MDGQGDAAGAGVGAREVLLTLGLGVGVAAGAALLGAAGALGAGALAAPAFAARRGRAPRPRAAPEWDDDGRLRNWPDVLRAVAAHGGLDPGARRDLWPLLLGVFPPDSTAAERAAEARRLRAAYAKLVGVCEELDRQVAEARDAAEAAGAPAAAALRSPRLPGALAAFAEAHRIIVMDAVRTDLAPPRPPPRSALYAGAGGAAPGWVRVPRPPPPPGGGLAPPPPPKLAVLPVAGGDGLPELMLAPRRPPAAPAAGGSSDGDSAPPSPGGPRPPTWRSRLAAATLGGAAHLDARARGQMLRLVNVLSAYAVADPEIGYCQGMSDLAAVFVQLTDDDALAYALFERLMRRARQNFRHDETGIRAQLRTVGALVAAADAPLAARLAKLGAGDYMFAYRMVVVLLRRELPLAEASALWETAWALGLLAAPGGAGGAEPAAAAAAPGAAAARRGGGRPAARGSPTAAAAAGREATLASLGAAAPAPSPRGEPPPDFLLQFVAAVVRAQRARLLRDARDVDDVLRLFNGVRVDFWAALDSARRAHKAYAQGAAVLRRL